MTGFENFVQCNILQDLEFDKDLDIQEALIGVARRENRGCPLVLIYDEQMPELSMSYEFMKVSNYL
jgi:hypothetical protein